MSDAINPLTGRHLSGRPAARGPAQAEWDARNPNYTQQWGMLPRSPQSPGQPSASSFSAYSPGQAQPAADPGGGKPSGPGPGRLIASMQNYAPGQAQPQQSPWASSTRYPQPQTVGQPVAFPAGPPGAAPMAAPPFQANTQNFDGTQSQMPNFQQRDAFIAQINNQLGQMQQQSQQRPGMGPPQFNFGQMWGQAGNMVQQGWQNPFAQQPAGQQQQAQRNQQQTGQQPPGLRASPEQQAAKAREYARYGVDMNSPAFRAFGDQYFNDPRMRPRPDAYSPQEVAAAFRQWQQGGQTRRPPPPAGERMLGGRVDIAFD